MKCQRCSGNGKYKTIFGNTIICDFCYGTGEITYGDDDKIEPIGNKKPMTNEEWLRSCPPQELIRFLMNVAYGGQIRSVQKRTFDEEAEKWSKWLKEKHTE